MRTLFAILILLPVFPGAAPAQLDKTPEKAPPCRISGRVVSAIDGAPLKSSRVALIEETAKTHPQVFAATTDVDGHFEIKNVIAGRYNFFTTHLGYVDQQYQAKGTGEGAVLSLQAGQEVTDVLFRLIRAGVIAGRILDEGGEPLAKVTVSALRKPTAEEREDASPRHSAKERLITSSETITDDRGEYRLYGLKPGEYYVKASESSRPMFFFAGSGSDYLLQQALGSEYAPQYYPGVAGFDQAQAVAVHAGDEIEAGFNLRHVLGVEVAGKVIGPDGKPPSSSTVRLQASGMKIDFSDDYSAITGSKGEFSLKDVPPGNYLLTASEYDEGKLWQTRQKIEVGERKIDSLVLALGRGNTITGRLIFAGPGSPPSVDRVMLVLEPVQESTDDLAGLARANKDGTFEILDVPDGSYTVRVHPPERGWYVKLARFGPDDVLEKGLQIEAGSGAGNLEIVMSSATAQLEGSVTQGDKPAIGAQVRVRPDPETPYNEWRANAVTTDQNGHFSIPDLAPGKYRVSAKLTADSGVSAPKAEEQTIALHEGDRQSVQLTLEEPKEQ